MRGKTIKLYIMGDNFKHLKSAELSNWTGKSFIGNRKHVQIIQGLEELSVPGVYFLLSELEGSLLKRIYVGEADEVNKRIAEQFKSKDWWDDFVIFISKDSNLTKSHVRFIEKELYELLARNNTTIELNNSNTPPGSKLPVSDCDDMNDYVDNLVFVLGQLGIIDFTKTKNIQDEILNEKELDNIFFMNVSGRKGELGKIAKLVISDNSYISLKGSYVKKDSTNSFGSHNYSKLRKEFEINNYFISSDSDSFYELTKNIEFNSPSAAAAIVRNSSINGRKVWKLENGMNLDEYENR
ncbi:MAG: GIY-YIG nuclease family protein [Candidatus Pristimantibacillus lignocellulolyticus]|uniref:GIY-YIG nuclease family protein n=1 Tax=Candidatus Pristimantibacillus lignocellulolyticus TaxID=2994561 RepID=A0A9J6ZAH8_9BACL|nr:MAG: GIY-YIG nuclease family protein [Candidatus Pristimantibacillus lignocellulolyticus]